MTASPPLPVATLDHGPLTRAAHRLRKALGGAEDTRAGVLVVSSRHRLWQRYGPDGVFAIERAVGSLIDAMGAHGLAGSMAYIDDSPYLGHLGVLPAASGSADEAARVVRDVCARVAWTERPVTHVLIVGGDDVLPFHRPPNPAPEDGDELRSDQPYAADPDDPFRPVRGVGRLPDPDLDTLLAGLRHAAAAHRRVAASEPLLLQPAGFGYSASIWKRAARDVFGTLGEPNRLRLSPPLTHRELPEPGNAGPRFRYFNLHGLADSPHWFGQRDPSFPADYPLFPVALRPVDLDPAPGSVVFSEACFGAHIAGRSVRDSVALTYIAGGALAFVGATGVAYGGLDGPLVAADLLAQRFWQATLAGASAGTALAFAKRRLVEEALARQGYLDAEDEKAVLNFVLFGDPSLIHQVPILWAEDASDQTRSRGAVKLAEPAERVGTLPVRPPSKSAGVVAGYSPQHAVHARHHPGIPRHALDAVRQTIAKRLPEFGEGDVAVSTALAPRRVAAKSTMPTERHPVVVTLQKNLLTSCGTPCKETVRVTVDASGAIRKVVVNR